MKRIMTAVLALAMVTGLCAGLGSGQALAKSKTARNVAIGVAAGVAAAIILNEAAKANARDECPGDSYRNKYGKCVKDYEPASKYESNAEIVRKCNRFLRKCEDGEKWACRKADDYCDRG